jgi:hypothetical protein
MAFSAIIIVLIIILIWVFYNRNQENYESSLDKSGFYTIDSGVPGPCIGIIAGVHGNERSGPIELLELLKLGKLKKIKKGKLKIVPCANVIGFERNLRWRDWLFSDLNRIFDSEDSQVLKIIDYLSECDVVIDFHEAWGWHLIDSNSTGNTIVPIGCTDTAAKIVDAVNSNPVISKINEENPNKKFIIGQKYVVCKFTGTLSCWMNNHRRKYMLIEVAGQNNIQPLEVRRIIVRTIIFKLLDVESLV